MKNKIACMNLNMLLIKYIGIVNKDITHI